MGVKNKAKELVRKRLKGNYKIRRTIGLGRVIIKRDPETKEQIKN